MLGVGDTHRAARRLGWGSLAIANSFGSTGITPAAVLRAASERRTANRLGRHGDRPKWWNSQHHCRVD